MPAIALTRRGDLRTKLAAFEWGTNDILGESDLHPTSLEQSLPYLLAANA